MLAWRGFEPESLEYRTDPVDDGVNDGGEPRKINDDLDIVRTFTAWGTGPRGRQERVLLAAVQLARPLEVGWQRGAAIVVAIDRRSEPNAPASVGEAGYAGTDLIGILNVDLGETWFSSFDAESGTYHLGGYRTRRLYSGVFFMPSLQAVLVSGDTVLFVINAQRSERPRVRFITQSDRWFCQRWPPAKFPPDGIWCDEPVAGAGALDFAPAGGFLDIDNNLGRAGD